MNTVTVSTKEEFEKAVNNGVDKIIITGNLAQEIIKAQKKKDVGKKVGVAGAVTAVAAGIAGVALAPVTAGASIAASGAVAHAVITVGAATVTLSTAEFIAGIAGVLGVAGFATSIINTVAKNYNVKISAGGATVECTKK